VWLLRGECQIRLGQLDHASQSLCNAAVADPFQYEAIETLFESHLLTAEQERNFLNALMGRIPSEVSWLYHIYGCMAKKV